jgi:hypothetical protein
MDETNLILTHFKSNKHFLLLSYTRLCCRGHGLLLNMKLWKSTHITFVYLEDCKQRKSIRFLSPINISTWWSDYRRILEWWLDLLDTYRARHHISQITTTHRPVCSVRLLGTDHTENTVSTVLLLLRMQLLLRSRDGYRPFPSKGRLCWFHNSCFEQICHNI